MKKLFDLVVNKQLLKFGITGIISNLINLLFYSISFIFFGTNVSVFIVYFTGLIFSYYSNKYWTFKFDKKKNNSLITEKFQYLILNTISLFLMIFLVNIFLNEINSNHIAAWFFGAIPVAILNFIISKKIFT